MNEDILTVEEVIERAKAEMPHMKILDARHQYTKALAHHVLDLHEKPVAAATVDDLLGAMEMIIDRLGPDHFFTRKEEDRAVQWADTLPTDLRIFFLMRLAPLVNDDNRTVIATSLEFWK